MGIYVPIEKIERRNISNRDFNSIKKEMENTFQEREYKIELIKKDLADKKGLRRIYGLLMVLSPARMGDLRSKVAFSKATIYKHLYFLIDYNLVKKISIMDIWNKEDLDKEEQSIIVNFKEWTEKMAKGQKEYFAAKTNYFVLTEFGKNPEIAEWALRLEKEQKDTSSRF